MTKEELNGFAGVVRTIVREELEPINERLGRLESWLRPISESLVILEERALASRDRVFSSSAAPQQIDDLAAKSREAG